MIFRKLEYTIAEAIVGIRRNGFMGLATVTIIALTLAVFGAFALTAMGANNFALSQINKFQIVAFGSTENESEIEAALDEIKNIDGVKSAQLCDREKEWESFKKQYPNIDVSGVKGVNGNPLPYRIDVKVADSAKTSAVADKIRDIEHIDRVNDSKEMLGRVKTLAHALKIISLIGCAVLFVASLFVVSNAIKLTLYARRHEIRTMQLVGATNAFIRIPLVIEGIFFGAVGAFLSWLLIQAGGIYVMRTMHGITGMFRTCRTGVSPETQLCALLILGVFVGMWGSLISMRRFLKLQ